MAPNAQRDPDWIPLSQASRVLGVSPATLRRWSDPGRLSVFTTPCGHPRFSRAALERLLPADRLRRPSIAAGGITASRMARTYRRASREVGPELPWIDDLSDKQRLLFRERGQVMTATLLLHLDATHPETAEVHLEEASGAAEDYGRMAAGFGLSLSQTVEGFVRFRAPFHHELALTAKRRGFDADETTDLLVASERAMDLLLIATVRGHGDPVRA